MKQEGGIVVTDDGGTGRRLTNEQSAAADEAVRRYRLERKEWWGLFAAVIGGSVTAAGLVATFLLFVFETQVDHNADLAEVETTQATHFAAEEEHDEAATATLERIEVSIDKHGSALQTLHTNQAILMRELDTRRPAPLPAGLRRAVP